MKRKPLKNNMFSDYERALKQNGILTLCIIVIVGMLLSGNIMGLASGSKSFKNIFTMAEFVNTTYKLSKSDGVITLAGSDGNTSTVDDANTTYSLDKDSDGKIVLTGSDSSSSKVNPFNISSTYPVGSIYTTVGSENPTDLFGGTWEKIEGRSLVGTGTVKDSNSASVSYTTGDKGGNVNTTLSASNLPPHNHAISGSTTSTTVRSRNSEQGITGQFSCLYWSSSPNPTGVFGTDYASMNKASPGSGSAFGRRDVQIDATRHDHLVDIPSLSVSGSTDYGNGLSDSAFSNMSPYYVVNIWKRTA